VNLLSYTALSTALETDIDPYLVLSLSSVLGGRNWEGFSPDPYLSGEAVRETVEGMQSQGVTGLVKHYFGSEYFLLFSPSPRSAPSTVQSSDLISLDDEDEQEYLRIGSNVGGYFPSNETQTLDSIIDDATVHELYVAPFAEASRAGAGAIMASYNKLNGTLASEDPYSLKTLLKGELGFKGFVLFVPFPSCHSFQTCADGPALLSSDWGSAHNTIESALSGLDFVEGGSPASNLWGELLRDPIANGTLPKDILDDKILRILTPYFALDQASLPETDYSRSVISKDHNKVIREISNSAITLLKNDHTSSSAGLPIKDPRSIILVGSAASEGRYGIISNQASGIFYYTPTAEYIGAVTDGFGSGGSPAPYVVTPLEGIKSRAYEADPPIFVDGYYSE
jgi:beta-glucosidase